MSVQTQNPAYSTVTPVDKRAFVADIFRRKQSLIATYLDVDRVNQFAEHLQQSLDNKQPRIMFYGLYSAGKSATINALIGEAVAQEGRNPTTDRVTRYSWGGFELDDTPGVDAPPEHEQVTQQQLEQSDLVLFVVSASAALDDQHTYSNILRLLSQQRKVMLVVNWRRDTPTTEQQIAVNDSLRQQLQQQALAIGLSDREVLAQVPIHWINAKMGLQGKQQNKALLLNQSGLPEFEHALQCFISQTNQHQLERRLAAELVRLAKEAQHSLQLRMDALGSSGYQRMANRVQEEQNRIRGQLQQPIRRQAIELANRYKQLAQSGQDAHICEQQLNQLIDDFSQEVEQQLQQQLTQTTQMLEQLAIELDNQQAQLHAEVEIPDGVKLPGTEEYLSSSEQPKPLLPDGTMQLLMEQIKTEHLVKVMKMAKDLLPNLFKGIGLKTMEKWAEKLLGVTRIGGPLVQTGIQLISGLLHHYQQEKQIQQEQAAMIRFHEQVRAAAEQIAGQYQQSMQQGGDHILRNSLQPAQRFIENSLQQLDQQSAALGGDNSQLGSIIHQLQLNYHL
ncbi:50S ribosome-binding GTPase [Vibrio metschnikovii]|nr:50S ribosome-binding GTPase [Vibrio metschnikovii]EKO3691533.1 50S ribosome-binding GTPase [Vibrio metschnikovii]